MMMMMLTEIQGRLGSKILHFFASVKIMEGMDKVSESSFVLNIGPNLWYSFGAFRRLVQDRI